MHDAKSIVNTTARFSSSAEHARGCNSEPTLPNLGAGENLLLEPEEQNPLLRNIPAITSPTEAMSALLKVGTTTENAENRLDDDPLRNIFVPTLAHAHILMDVVAQVRLSYEVRDLRLPEIRNFALSSNQMLHSPFDRSGHRIPAKAGMAPNAVPRGIVVCAMLRTGRRSLADAIENFLGKGHRIVRVNQGSSFIDYTQLMTLRVSFPIKGDVRGFANNFVAAFDSAMGTQYSFNKTGPLRRTDECISAICSLATIANLGLVIVERINNRAASLQRANELWDALAVFTRTTGITILSMMTPGAASSLAEHGSAIGDVATKFHNIEIPMPHAPAWKKSAGTFFSLTIARVTKKPMPDWFVATLWDVSCGRIGIASKACAAIANFASGLGDWPLDQKQFIAATEKILALEKPYLEAIRITSVNLKFDGKVLRKYGDWLPLSAVLAIIPLPIPIDAPILASGGQ